MRQGGLDRRPGTRFVANAKFNDRDTILFSFEVNIDNAYIIEVGHLYMRFYKNKAQITEIVGPGVPVEIATPYTEGQIRSIHFTQSVSVLYLFHPDVAPHQLSHVDDQTWVLDQINFNPPATFEANKTFNNSLTPGATSGDFIPFVANAAIFLEADVGRQIVSGASLAIITGFGTSAGDTTSPNTTVRAHIISAFPDTLPIAPGDWELALSPQTDLNPDKKGPVGTEITLVAAVNAFRASDIGGFILIHSGLIRLTALTDATTVRGEILSELQSDEDDPPEAPAGGWSLREAAWSATRGYPRTVEFFNNRLGVAATYEQPTTWWLSVVDRYDNFAIGALAELAVEYTMTSRRLNRIEWMADNGDLFLGTSGAEMIAKGGKTDEPIGGDVLPRIDKSSNNGSAPVQPAVIDKTLVQLDRSRRKIFVLSYDFETNNFVPREITAAADHITAPMVRLGPVSFQQRLDVRLFYVRTDGQVIAFTNFPDEKVIGFTRLRTEGQIIATACKPQAAGRPDHLWMVVERTVNGQQVHYVEVVDEQVDEVFTRDWQMLETDCAVVYKGVPTASIPVPHLEGMTVDIVGDGGYRGQAVVAAGIVSSPNGEEYSEWEVGLHYDSICKPMRPAIPNVVTEGLPRSWDSIFIRILDSMGGTVDGEILQYTPDMLDETTLATGDIRVTGQGWNTDGRIQVVQDQPYPFTLLSIFGTISFADKD